MVGTTGKWKPKISSVSIVLRGSFNPPIFHPSWFAGKNLISESESLNAADLVVSSEVTNFSLDWMVLQATRDRFIVSSKNPAMAPNLRDLVWGTFTTLEHTPLTQLGLNSEAHFEMESERQWHALGHLLAPKKPWQDVFSGHVGMRTLAVEGHREGSEATFVRVSVQPSIGIPNGVHFQFNEHYVAPGPTEKSTTPQRPLLTILKENWEAAYDFAGVVQAHILNQKTDA